MTLKQQQDQMQAKLLQQLKQRADELVNAATEQMHKLPYYNSFFKTGKSDKEITDLILQDASNFQKI